MPIRQTKGWLGGFQLGYNYQFNWLVLGLQGGFDWAGINRHFSCFSFGNQTCSADNEWIATLSGRSRSSGWLGALVCRGRAGVDAGDGVEYCQHRSMCSDWRWWHCVLSGHLFLGSEIRAGWNVGGGVEYRLSPNWSTYIQYNYMQFGEHPITLVDGGSGVFPEESSKTSSLSRSGSTTGLPVRRTAVWRSAMRRIRIWRAPLTTLTSGLGSFPSKTSARIAPILWLGAFSRSRRSLRHVRAADLDDGWCWLV